MNSLRPGKEFSDLAAKLIRENEITLFPDPLIPAQTPDDFTLDKNHDGNRDIASTAGPHSSTSFPKSRSIGSLQIAPGNWRRRDGDCQIAQSSRLVAVSTGQVAAETLRQARALGGGLSAENSLDVAASLLATKQGDFETAEREAQVDLERRRKIGGLPSIEMADALHALALAQFGQGQFLLAETSLHEAISILRPEINQGAPMLLEMQSDLAKIKRALYPDDNDGADSLEKSSKQN